MLLVPMLLLMACAPATEETNSDDLYAGWEVTDSTDVGFLGYNYIREVWEITPSASQHFDTPFGENRRFYLLRPRFPPATATPLLTLLHGGGVDDDSAPDYYDNPSETMCWSTRAIAEGHLDIKHFQLHEAMQRGWAVVVPENLFCDFWAGLGSQDPVDPTNHRSNEHFFEVLDFLYEGRGGFEISDLYFWGNSAGGAGAVTLSDRYGKADAIIVDSAPCNTIGYYDDAPNELGHIFGGAPYKDDATTPTPYLQNYLNASCNWLVSDGGMRTPMFVPFNTRDQITQSYSPLALADALQATYPAEGVRYGTHNFNHNGPSSTFHTQAKGTTTLTRYTTTMMFEFLVGASLTWVEAEDGCAKDSCDVGLLLSESNSKNDILRYASNSALRVVTPQDGAGVFYTAPIPEEIATANDVTATIILQFMGQASAEKESVIATIHYQDAHTTVTQDVRLMDLVYDNTTDEGVYPLMQQQMAQTSATSISLPIADPSTATLSVQYTGLGDKEAQLWLDAVVYQVR
jgi:hypothetical protein